MKTRGVREAKGVASSTRPTRREGRLASRFGVPAKAQALLFLLALLPVSAGAQPATPTGLSALPQDGATLLLPPARHQQQRRQPAAQTSTQMVPMPTATVTASDATLPGSFPAPQAPAPQALPLTRRFVGSVADKTSRQSLVPLVLRQSGGTSTGSSKVAHSRRTPAQGRLNHQPWDYGLLRRNRRRANSRSAASARLFSATRPSRGTPAEPAGSGAGRLRARRRGRRTGSPLTWERGRVSHSRTVP